MQEDLKGELNKMFKSGRGAVMSSKERRQAVLLIVDTDASIRHTMRQTLMSLGYFSIQDASEHVVALQRLEESEVAITHVIFDAKNSRMPAKDFLKKALEFDPKLIAIPSSYEPTIDDVFDLLIAGARGFVCKPFTSEALDETIVMATKGDPLSDALSYASTRNEALASVILSSLNKLAMVKRQAQKFQTARREVPLRESSFRRSVEIGLTFAKGGPTALRDSIVKLCIERCEAGSGKVGRIKRRSAEKREEHQLRKDPKRSDTQN